MAERMLEGAARAFYEDLQDIPWNAAPPAIRRATMTSMRAAIEALLEPSASMLKAGRDAVVARKLHAAGTTTVAYTNWVAMIRGLLEEEG